MSVPPRYFSDEQIAFIRDRVERGIKNKALFDEFKETFNEPLSECIFWKVKRRNGINNKTITVASFTEEEKDFVLDLVNRMIPQRKIVDLFNEMFQKNIGQTQLRRMMQRAGIESVRKERVAVPIGYEYYNSYYKCMMVKVSNERTGWKLKQNIVWEHENGKPLPRHHVVMFLDGDRDNYAPDNLYAVPLCVAGNVEKWQMHSEDPMIYKSALMYGELYFLMMKEAPEVMDRMKRK
jgi:hypothetical protein